MTDIPMLKARNAHGLVEPLLAYVVKYGRSKTVEGRERIQVHGELLIELSKPFETAVLLPACTPNPFVRVAEMLRSHARLPEQRLVPYTTEDPFDALPSFEPTIGLGADTTGEVLMTAGCECREVVADTLTRDLLELGVMMELVCVSTSRTCGALGVRLIDPWVDIRAHAALLEGSLTRVEHDDIHGTGFGRVPLAQKGRMLFKEEARLLLEADDATVMGLSDPWLRRVAQPMLQAFSAHRNGNHDLAAERADRIGDPAWRLTALSWLQMRSPRKSIPKPLPR